MKSLSVIDNINGLKLKKEQLEKEALRIEGSINILQSLLEAGIKDIAIPEEENKEVIDEDAVRSGDDTDLS
jgi:hypothetical protein